MDHRNLSHLTFVIALGLLLTQCSDPLPWPESPLYDIPVSDPAWQQPEDLEAAHEAIAGRYAHYDVVAYEDNSTDTPLRTFIVSYGFTEFYRENGKLLEKDVFCHAEQKINQKSVSSIFRDEATQAIKPRIQEVEVFFENGAWRIYRPATPTLLGIVGDPSLALSMDRNDPNIIDADGDGNPGVTVDLKIGGLINGQLYIIRREIFNNHLTLHSNQKLYGYVEDESEQFVVGASLSILDRQANPDQNPDYGLSPLILVPISPEIDSCDKLMANRDRWFPLEPEFK